jgi:hypothetical protein
MLRVLLSVLICISILYTTGCIDDGPWSNCPPEKFSEEFKRYTMFNVGSYWIYEDSSGNFTDSIVLTSQSLDFYPECDYTGYPFERLTQTFYSSFLGNLEAVGNPDWEDYYVSQNEYQPVGFFINGVPLEQAGGSRHQMRYEEFLYSSEINGRWYNNVKIISTVAAPRIKFHWAENVGVIKKSFPYPLRSDSVYHFELIRYKLK